MKPKKTGELPNVIIWGGWYGSYNVGDQILLLTIPALLDEVRRAVYYVPTPAPEVVWTYTRQEGRSLIFPLHSKRQLHRLISIMSGCKLFVFGGGVPFYDQTYHVLVMLFLVSLAKLFKVPYMTWAVSSLQVKSPLVSRVYGWILQGAAGLTCRDEFTRSQLREWGVRRAVEIVPDPGVCLEIDPPETARDILASAGWDGIRPLVALTPRTLRSADGEAETHFRPKSGQDFEREIAVFAGAVDWLWENGYQPVFIPMNTIPPDDDRYASRLVITRARHGREALMVDHGIRPSQAPALYGVCEAGMVARVHGSITAALGGCPVVMYAFEHKHAGIMASLGLEDYILNGETSMPDSAIAVLRDLLAARQALRSHLRHQLEVMRRDARRPAVLAAEILDGEIND
jgi:polysaccharide pyruvyl transferase WcaK-like protein